MSMFDMRNIKVPSFEITLLNGKKLSLNSARVKTMRKLTNIEKEIRQSDDKVDAEIVDELIEVILQLLNNNKEKYIVKTHEVENWELIHMLQFITEYMGWIAKINQSKK